LREELVETILLKGPSALPDGQKNALLADPLFLSQLHFRVWTSAQAHPQWRTATGQEQGAARRSLAAGGLMQSNIYTPLNSH
jgi:membrane glycosyltransferase